MIVCVCVIGLDWIKGAKYAAESVHSDRFALIYLVLYFFFLVLTGIGVFLFAVKTTSTAHSQNMLADHQND